MLLIVFASISEGFPFYVSHVFRAEDNEMLMGHYSDKMLAFASAVLETRQFLLASHPAKSVFDHLHSMFRSESMFHHLN